MFPQLNKNERELLIWLFVVLGIFFLKSKFVGIIFVLMGGAVIFGILYGINSGELTNTSAPFWVIIFGSLFGLFFIFMGISVLFPKVGESISKVNPWKSKCTVCGQIGLDLLINEDLNKNEHYCRMHLIQQFAPYFRSNSYKMVIFQPEFERQYCGSVFGYYPLNDMVDGYDFPKEDQTAVTDILITIKGSCMKCNSREASIAYFQKGILKWDKNTGPLLSESKGMPEFLCKECAWELLMPDIQNNKDSLSEGLYAPSKSNGVYVSTFI